MDVCNMTFHNSMRTLYLNWTEKFHELLLVLRQNAASRGMILLQTVLTFPQNVGIKRYAMEHLGAWQNTGLFLTCGARLHTAWRRRGDCAPRDF